MSGIHKTKMQINLLRLRDWYEALGEYEYPTHKDDSIDYAKDYFEPGSRGYGWSLHSFERPVEAKQVRWVNIGSKDDPMIRSKGRIFFKDGTKCFIGNEHFTKRRGICDGYMNEILDEFPEAYRGVVWSMQSGFKFVEHTDYPKEETFRIHVVLYTNPDAMFKISDQVVHMKDDGYLWMVNTGCEMHTAWNYGETDRIHVHWQMPITVYDKYMEKLG